MLSGWPRLGRARALAFTLAAAAATTVAVRAQQTAQPAAPAAPEPAQTSTQPAPVPEVDIAVLTAGARHLAHLYSERLRQNITQALKEGGPIRAIDACNTLAPELNATVADGTLFEVARTALRVRNPDNAPDSWEQANLEAFQKSLIGGADSKTLETFEIVATKEGQKLFRYMRPITMREPCLACHGPSVAPDVKAEIAKHYPDDKAIGYNIGELRGAFSIVQQLD